MHIHNREETRRFALEKAVEYETARGAASQRPVTSPEVVATAEAFETFLSRPEITESQD